MSKSALNLLSFRHLLFLVFALTVLPMSGTSIHALFTIERLAESSRETARDAIRLTENAQRLNERTIAMERSARQFLILQDDAFLGLYREAEMEAREMLKFLSAALPAELADEFREWDKENEAARSVLQQASYQVPNSGDLNQIFSRLSAINNRLALESKKEVERQNSELLEELERQRSILAAMVLGTMLLAAALAFGFGIWLSRPLKRIESAIGHMGENRFDQAVEVDGPADLQRLGQQLDWLRRRLAELESEKSRFLRHVSHELKTPLAAIFEGVALLREGIVGELNPKQHEVLNILRANTVSLQKQIDDLLRYNAAVFDMQQLRTVPVDIVMLLHQVIDTQRLQWQARGLQVGVEGASPLVKADSDKLAIVLGNLLSNAVRFSPDGGTIRFVLSNEDGRVRLDCIDDGPGVASSDAARIFEPFYQGTHQPPGPRRGSGIGLSIVREYIEAHRGTVQLLPRDKGAHFRIELIHES